MPVAPDASETLSGGSGITSSAFVQRVLRDRLDDDPVTERALTALDGAGVTDSLTVRPGALRRFQVGGWIDFVEDGTFETLLIEEVVNDTTLTLRRAHRGSTIASHLQDAVFRYRGRVNPLTVSNAATKKLGEFWPDVFEVRAVSHTVPTLVDLWYNMPADAERVLDVYQRTTGSVTDVRPMSSWSGIHRFEVGFSATNKAIKVTGVASNAPDNKLHTIYIAKAALARLTDEQVALLECEVAMSLMASEFAGESKPERRSGIEGAPDSMQAMRLFSIEAEGIRKREAKRLSEYLPRKEHRSYRGLRHYSDDLYGPYHPVKSF